MPYRTIDKLPRAIRGHLPARAQEVYLAAFNGAWDKHANGPSGEAAVHRIAWAAVKRRYRRTGDQWVLTEG